MDKGIKLFIVIVMSLFIGGFIGWLMRGSVAARDEKKLWGIIYYQMDNPDVVREIIRRLRWKN